MLGVMADTPSADRLLAIIELQNAIAAAALNADEVMRVVAERAALLTSATSAIVELVEGDDVVCRASSGATQQLGQRKSSKNGLTGRSISDRKPAQDTGHVAVPIMHGEYAVGVLAVSTPRSGAFTGEDVETLRLLANIIAIPLHRTRSFPRPRYDNTHDALTGLLNRRAFLESTTREVARAKRYNEHLSVILLDVDHFKHINDKRGHAAGDMVLSAVGKLLNKSLRTCDIVARWGGEEFVLVLPSTPLSGAEEVAERVRSQLASAVITDGNGDAVPVTASFGVAAYGGAETLEQVIDRADRAMYLAKSGGRNRVVCDHPAAFPQPVSAAE
jgi:diguanylate cyclase (GGDEF)-like protein